MSDTRGMQTSWGGLSVIKAEEMKEQLEAAASCLQKMYQNGPLYKPVKGLGPTSYVTLSYDGDITIATEIEENIANLWKLSSSC